MVSIFTIILLIQPTFASGENLYVSRDAAEKKILGKTTSNEKSKLSLNGGCTSFAPPNYDRKSFTFYIDELNPTFDVGFLKKNFR